MSNIYRPDIDGLRAVAVVSVIFCHALIPGFDGGFVGVDIFFVISGFLISNIILREMTEGSFTFKNFYVRRIRRILPALLTVLAMTTVLAAFLLLPEDFRKFGKGLIASIIMMPNIAAWITSTDYFGTPPDTNQLLHLWSLGVEEQFYFLFPLLLWLLTRKFTLRMCWLLLITISALSLALSFWAAATRPEFGFYWLPTRAWEFLFGIIVAYYQATRKIMPFKYKGYPEILATVALLLIVCAVCNQQSSNLNMAFRYQILACVGATTLIALGAYKRTWVHKLLAFRPIVAIGLISYSLYLWHWPLLSLLSYWQGGINIKGKELILIGVLTLSTVLATLTWQYVEQPCRNKYRWPNFRLITTVSLVQIALLGVGGLIWQTQGAPQRFNDHQRQYALSKADVNPLRSVCVKDVAPGLEIDTEQCVVGRKPNQLPRFVIWGDSHSDAITPAFSFLAEQYGISGIQATLAGAGSFLNANFDDRTSEWNNNWQHFNNSVVKFIKTHPSITDVFIINRWGTYVLERTAFETHSFNGKKVVSSFSYHNERNQLKAVELSLKDTVSQLTIYGKRVWLILPVPEADRDVPRWLTMYEKQQKDVWIKGYPKRRTFLLPLFKQMESEYGARLLVPTDSLCRNDKRECRINANGKAIYFDDDHLSAAGAVFIANTLRPAFELMKKENAL